MSHASGPPPTPAGPGDAPRAGRSRVPTQTATLLTLVVLLVVGFVWGVSALTAPFGDSSDTSDTSGTGAAGVDDPSGCPSGQAPSRVVRPREAVVSVLNAGTRRGRAAEIMGELTDQGFRQGVIGNAPAGVEVAVVEIWSARPTAAATRLVRSTLPTGTLVRPVPAGVRARGVIVVVGDGLDGVTAASTSVRALASTPACAGGS